MRLRSTAALLVPALVAAVASVAAAADGTPAIARPIIKPEDVRPGMRGYGLTVIRGTEPERFEIEVIGRLHNALPQQDIILVRCDDPKIEKIGVAQGMSGSPIFVVDAGVEKLMGALAYAWSFQSDPIAGITPIVNMSDGLLSRGAAGRKPARGAAGASCVDPAELAASLRRGAEYARGSVPLPGALRPVTTPLTISGMSSQLMGELRSALAPLGLEPVQGGASGEGVADTRPFRPGDAIGVQLMRGDSEWTAIGTVTHVEGARVLAFGHPFLFAGPWTAPVTRARVEWTLARDSISFKLATPTGVVGSLLDDLQSCIVAELGPAPAMVPLEVSVTGEGRAPRDFAYEVVQHKHITGMLAFYAAVDSITSAYPLRDAATLRVEVRIEIAGHEPLEVDWIEQSSASYSYSLARPIEAILGNPFEDARLARVRFVVGVTPGRSTAHIVSVRPAQPVVKAGGTASLSVRLRPFDAPDEFVELEIPIGEEFRGKKMALKIVPAGDVTPDVAPPTDFAGLLRLMEAAYRYPETSLAIVTESLTRGIRSEGVAMAALPSSAINVLSPAGGDGVASSRDFAHALFETRWVLSGGASLTLDVVD